MYASAATPWRLQAKRELISAIADSALASFVLINVAVKRSEGGCARARVRPHAHPDDDGIAGGMHA